MTTPPTTDTQPYLIALLGGAALWLLTSLISGRAEAWDAPMYWTVTYPLAILLAGVLGYRAPRRAWRWGLVVMLVQAHAAADLRRLHEPAAARARNVRNPVLAGDRGGDVRGEDPRAALRRERVSAAQSSIPV